MFLDKYNCFKYSSLYLNIKKYYKENREETDAFKRTNIIFFKQVFER